MCLFPGRSILKRPKFRGAHSNVRFDQVTVFSFPRCQGFTSVPRCGGATLGMVQRHSSIQRYSVADHALEQRQNQLREERSKGLNQNVSILHFYNSVTASE